MYAVVSGRLEVVIDDKVVNLLGRGEVVGELALLTGSLRSASIRARRDTRLHHLSAADFAAFSRSHVSVPLTLASALARRVQAIAPPQLGHSQAHVIAVVAADGLAPVAEVAAELMDQVGGLVRVIAPGRVDADGLERAEVDSDRVILVAGATDAEWRGFCLRAADRVVVVADRSVDPRSAVSLFPPHCDVVLTGASEARGLAVAWYDALSPASFQVVTPDALEEGLRPLAARLAGRALGLVLGGGGARAFAHIGVLEELEAAHIPIDRVAGTSAGAMIGALFAMGLDASSIDAAVYDEFVRRNPMNDYTLPRHALAGGVKARKAMVRRFGDIRIEELPREFRCVSVDLLRRRPFVHSRGSVVDAVLASLRLPGLFAPYVLGESLHVDGGVMENLPVDALAQRPDGPIVAVNVSLGGHPSPPGDSPRLPGLMDTLMRTMLLSSGSSTERALADADVVIAPQAHGVGLLEWHQIDVMRESGRAAARSALPAIRRLLVP